MDYENSILDYWRKKEISKKVLEKNKGGEEYIFYDGPPFATGLPHYGHILCSIVKDVVARYWRMKGYFVPARWGWDCHGLPIEEIVEKKLKISGKKNIEKMGIGKFNQTCRESVLAFASEWKEFIEKIGRFVDFENSYKTMDNDYIESVWWGLKEIYKKGLIYEGKKVLLYCPRCETPLSNFEIAMDNSYKDVTEESIFVKFLIKRNKLFADLDVDIDIFAIAWTTTPWTLPSNMALAVAIDLDYCLVKENKNYYIVADFFVQNNKNSKNPLQLEVIKKFKGSDLIGIKYTPVYSIDNQKVDFSKAYQIYSADFVAKGEGTGIVHIAPMHGEDDFNLGKKLDLPIFALIDEQGKFNELAPSFLEKTSLQEANKLVKKDLNNKDLLFQKESITHSCPFCYRCDTRLFYYAIPSWFINIQKIKDRLLELNQKINWTPKHIKDGRFGKGLESAPDWNISRNRYWAAPIPLWKCQNKECDHQEFIGSKDDILKQKHSTNNYFFMRHAECIGNAKDILSNAPEKFNNFLTEKGIKQAEESAKKLKDKKIDLIVASPLLRAKETAEIVAKELNYPIDKIVYSDKLREIDMGILSGKSINDWIAFFDQKLIDIDPSSEKYYSAKYATTIPEGESYLDVAKRFWSYIQEFEKKYDKKNVLIVSHGAPLKTIKNIFLGEHNVNENNIFSNAEVKKLDFKNLPYNENFELDFHRPQIDKVKFYCPKCSDTMVRIKEVLDCWVETGSMPFAELGYPYKNKEKFKGRFPADYISEYIAQTRAWFYVTHVINTILFDDISFKNCICTGVILNEKGEKMSKSKKNYPDPNLMLEKFGADALRLYLTSSPLLKADNLFFSERELKDNYKTISMLYNILSFSRNYLPKISESPTKISKNKKCCSIDKWLMLKLNNFIKKSEEAFIDYNIIPAARSIKDFANDFSWYLRVSRERLKQGDEEAIRIFKSVLLKLSKIIAPITPFLAEEIYQQISGEEESVHMEKWPEIYEDIDEKEIEKIVDELREVVTIALNKRSENQIKVRQPLASLTLKKDNLKEFPDLLEIIKKEANVKSIVFNSSLSTEDGIELDIILTEELENEGILREIRRAVQQLRKEAKLTPKDDIEIYFYTDNEIKEIISKQVASLKKENNIKEIFIKNKKGDEEIKEIKIGQATLGIRIKNLKSKAF